MFINFCFYIFGGFMSIVYIFEASVSKYSGNRIALPAEGLSGEAQEVPWEEG